MNITETSNGGVAVVALEGRLDMLSAPEFRNNRSIIDPEKTVVLDLEKLDFLDTSGLGAIVGASRQKQNLACGIVLSCMNDKVRRVFEITKVQTLFHIFDDTAAAIDFATNRQSAST
ncbi:MAG: STAS domain-containing protein [Chlorobaculum sp.]|jgi:anti-sigma B factor antagonist|nr:STAS domain-containing protein [Chlorobaculum sp.]